MKTFKRLCIASLLIVALAATASATGSTEPGGSMDAEPVPMRYVAPGGAPSELDVALVAINEKLAADGVGIEVEVERIGWDAWDQKTNLMLSTGEPFELLHVPRS